MRKILNNLRYFKISKENLESTLDKFYIFEKQHTELEKYIDNTKEIKNILITIKTLLNNKEKDKIVNNYFDKLSNTLGKFSNCSEFSCFVSACDSALKFVKQDKELLKEITLRYFKNRDLSEIVPREWVQAVLDTNSSRKKGNCGENKLLSILNNHKFVKVDTWEEFKKSKKCVAKFSSRFDLKSVRGKLNVKIKTKKQNKRLDLIIKFKNKIFFIEAKHLNTAGGGQDKQISELIEIISLKENNKNIHYISFLDGSYSNIILGDNKVRGKIKIQRREINKFLNQNHNNFWVNTAGFKKLIFDLK